LVAQIGFNETGDRPARTADSGAHRAFEIAVENDFILELIESLTQLREQLRPDMANDDRTNRYGEL
jgi:hypothetical protein